jgi:hypothetical protein
MNFFTHIRKLIILFCTLFLFRATLFSQTYYKIPSDTNHYWRQFSICQPNPNAVNRYDYQIRYYKDTVINSKIYNLYQRFGRSWGFEFCSSFTKRGFLRQDTLTKKIFILDANFVERPLYDFSKLVVGDTLQHYNKALNSVVTLTVQHMDTAYLNDGTKHKAQWVSNNNCFIEGVGSIFGGLYGDDQLPFTPNNISEQLMCYGFISPFFNLMDGITQQIYICSLVPATVGMEEYFFNQIDINIFPNPVRDKLHLELGFQVGNAKLSIYNTLGQIIYSKDGIDKKEEIDLGFLRSGVYYLKINNYEGQKTFKLLKE